MCNRNCVSIWMPYLDALIAAHEELGAAPEEAFAAALRQFGSPDRIGRRLARDWRREVQWPKHPDAFAFTYAYAWLAGTLAAFAGTACLWGVVATLGNLWLTQGAAFMEILPLTVGSIVPAIAGWMTGRKTGRRAVPAMAGAVVAVAAPLGRLGVLTTVFGDGQWEGMWGMGVMTACWLSVGCLSAYVSSARRCGHWYRPRLSDLRLCLRPHRA